MLTKLACADRVRKLADAPAPSGTANAITDQPPFSPSSFNANPSNPMPTPANMPQPSTLTVTPPPTNSTMDATVAKTVATEGTTISTKYGNVNTDYMLFIASGAFHAVKPSDMLPELQGRLPIRVELNGLTEEDLYKILTEPEANVRTADIEDIVSLSLQ